MMGEITPGIAEAVFGAQGKEAASPAESAACGNCRDDTEKRERPHFGSYRCSEKSLSDSD